MVLTPEQVTEIEKFLKEQLTKTLRVQGHYMTGKVAKEIKLVVEETTRGTSLLLYTLKYGKYLETGTPASKVKFSPGSGKGHSEYIDALVGWVEKRQNLTGKEALSRAFQIAYTHKREGIPSVRSKRWSKTGERTEWISNTFRDNKGPLTEIIRRSIRGNIEFRLISMIKKFDK